MMSRLLTLQRLAEIERVMRAYNSTNPAGPGVRIDPAEPQIE